MRLAGKEKGGHYPTPPVSQTQIVRHLRYPVDRPVRILDPCAGKGAAILAAARVNPLAANVEILAVENSPRYGHPCREALEDSGYPHRFLLCGWEEVSMSVETVGLLWLNPPYDFEALQAPDEEQEGKVITHRVEYTFLKSATPKLQPNGVLVYIVPLSVIQKPAVLRYLTSHYYDLQVRSFPDGEYEEFDQVVLFARNKGGAEHDPDAYKLLAELVKERPPALSMADDFTYQIPVRPEKLSFRKNQLTYAETVQLVAESGAQHDPKWTQATELHSAASFQPAAPLKLGHLATTLVSGLFQAINLGDRIVRGAATRVSTTYDQVGNVVDSNSPEAAEVRESFHTVIYEMARNGHYRVLRKPEELEQLLAEHIDLMQLMVLDQFTPLYNGDPTEAEWRTLDAMIPHKRLPGRNSAGLLLAQKHAVVAMQRVLDKYGFGWLIGDPGTGKSAMGYSVAHSLDAFPVLVSTPAHLVEKHKREALDTLGDDIKVVIAAQTSDILNAYREYEPGQKLVVIIGIPASSLGPGAYRVRVKRKVITARRDPDTNKQIGWKAVEREVCPHCGQPLDPKVERSSKQIVKCTNKKCQAPLYAYGATPLKHARRRDNPRWSFAAWAGMHSPETLMAYETVDGKKRAVRAFPGQRAAIRLEDYAELPSSVSVRRWPLARVIARRVPKGFFKLYIADEAHQFKAKGTDRGYAFQLLCNAARRVVLTTATPFGGYPTDLFYLMVRSMPSFRQQYGFHDVAKFIGRYGRRAFFYNKPKDDDEADGGKTTANKRYVVRDKVLPGISPLIYPELLPYAVFLGVTHLGYTLPPYEEQMIPVVASELLALQYAWLYDSLYEVIYDGMLGRNGHTMHEAMQLLSTWFVNTLRRPMSAFRSEVVMRAIGYKDEDEGIDTLGRAPFMVKRGESEKHGLTVRDDVKRLLEIEGHPSEFEVVNAATGQPERAKPQTAVDFDAKSDRFEAMTLYPAVAIDGLLPKEEWLIRAVKEQIADGRKVLLYLEQSGIRDIQPRIARILAKAGIRSVTVPSGDARGREAWIRERIAGVDVLITNPMKVREGLDLVDFSALIFYELPTSLVTLLQAMKRVWRLGQTRDVLVLVPYHVGMENSMEYHVLQLMAQKVRAAALLQGESASSAFADNATDADTAADLAKSILKKVADKLDMTGGIGSLLGDLVKQEMEASRAAQAEAEAAGEEAAGIGVYEAEDDPSADDAFYTEEEEEEEGEPAEPEIDVFSLFDLPEDIFAPLEGAMRTDDETEEPGEPRKRATDLLVGRPDNGTAPAMPSDYADTAHDIAWTEEHLANAEARQRWQPAVGDAVLINRTTRGTIKRIQGDEYHVEVMTRSGGRGIRKVSRFQMERAASAQAPAELSAETERTMTNKEVAQLLQSGRDAVLPDNIIPAEPVPPPAPETVWPHKTFQWEGVTHRMPDTVEGIGLPYDQVLIETEVRSDAGTLDHKHAWGSLADFIRATGFRFVADERYTEEDWRFLRERIAAGEMILIADSNLGLPTIHQMRNAQHHGHGFFSCVDKGCKVTWDAGGAMRTTRPPINGERNWSGISWTPLRVEEGSYPYPFEQVLAAIDWWLNVPQVQPVGVVTVPVEPADLPEPPAEEGDAADVPSAAADTETPEQESTAADAPGADDFFASWDMATTFDAATGVAVLGMKPKKAGARKAARAVGRTDAFKKMMTSEPEFKK